MVDSNIVPQIGVVKYYVNSGESKAFQEISLPELDHCGSEAYNGYFIHLEDDYIVAPQVMIWAQ